MCEFRYDAAHRLLGNGFEELSRTIHDIYDSSVAAALEIVDELKAKGFIFVTVDQLLLD